MLSDYLCALEESDTNLNTRIDREQHTDMLPGSSSLLQAQTYLEMPGVMAGVNDWHFQGWCSKSNKDKLENSISSFSA